jgi:hypothetical protein
MGQWSPEARERHQKKMQEIWAKKRRGGGTTKTALTVVGTTVPTAKPVRRMDLNGNVLTVIDGLIGRVAADLAAVQRTKEILEQQ